MLTRFFDVQYTTNYKLVKDLKQKAQYSGNNMKSLHNSVKDSLRKLRTDYIDIFYLHWVSYYHATLGEIETEK